MAIFVFIAIAVGKGHSSKTCHWKGTFIQLLAMVETFKPILPFLAMVRGIQASTIVRLLKYVFIFVFLMKLCEN